MNKKYKTAEILLAAALFFATGNAMAQKDTTRLRQEVEVTKAYQPTVTDAVKINDIPKIKPEQTEAPTFDYSIYSKPVFSTFDVTPVAAAKMVGEAKPGMGVGLLKLGVGNYQTPYGELFVNIKPGKNSNFGMHFSHLSSSGKIMLLNEDEVKANESQNTAEIFGKQFFRKATLSGSLGFDRKAFNYYGYSGGILTDEQKEEMIPYFQDKQYFSKGMGKVHLKSENLSKFDFNYDFGIKYHHLISKTGQTERETVLSGDVSKKIDSALGLLNASVTIYNADSILSQYNKTYGKKRQFLLRANPSFGWSSDNAGIQIGLNTALALDADTDASFYIWPKVKAEWSPVPHYLTLFAAVDGYLQHNTYSAIAAENPYVDPYHDVLNTNFKNIFSGGLKGKFNSKTNYVAQVSYSVVEDQHFYYTEGMDINEPASHSRRLNNTFSWLYDDFNILKLSGEVLHSVSDDFSFHVLGNFYSYKLRQQEKAWQMPDFDLTLSGIYKPTEQLKFTADIFVIGSRPALVLSKNSEDVSGNPDKIEVTMDPIIDMNAGVEYQFSDKLNLFFRLNNFGFQKYERWHGYTGKSFNWLAGISYSF